jgi:hypothetical protein
VDPELSRFQCELLLRLVRQGPVLVNEVAWQSVNVLRRNGLAKITDGWLSYTTEGLMVSVGLSLRGWERGLPWGRAA